ncbi:hypothetical protein ACJJTC_000004 [Scirpophaga incertulas]
MWVLLLLALAAPATADCPPALRVQVAQWKRKNKLTTLRDDAFAAAGLLNLQRLYLSSCNIRTIRQFAFRALVNLVELDLTRNRLDSIPSQAFSSIPELRELRLNGNPISKVPDDAFLRIIPYC